MNKNNQISPKMAQLSNYMAGAHKRKLPEEVVERAKIHLVDTFGAMISGSAMIAGKRAIAYVKPMGATREAGIVGTRIVTSATYAALANGMCGHADETDLLHPPSRWHPGVTVTPAVLAVAEQQRRSGEDILRALVAGYDVGTRVLLALNQAYLKKTGHKGTSIGGLFGAATAVAVLLRLDAQRMRYVLAYCGEQAAGLYLSVRETDHVEKAFTCGMAAHNGVAAARMVKSGFTGVNDVFTGEDNFLHAFSPEHELEAVVRGLGKNYEILRGAIKYWPAGGPIQGPLHVLYDLIRQHGIKADDVEKLVARMPDVEFKIVDSRDMTDVSVQHLLALMLVDGTLTFATAHDYGRTKDPKIVKLRRRIEVIGDASLTDPLRRWRCVMEITLKDGRTLSHQTMSAKGGAENPLTRQEEEKKAHGLIAPVLGKKRSQALISALYNIEAIKDARALRRLYAH